MFIPDPESNFSITDPESRVKKIPDPASRLRINELSILTHKIVLGNMIRNVHRGSGSWFYPSRILDSGVKKALDPGSWIRIGNTAQK